MRRGRVRHHTSDTNLDQIRTEGAIYASRGWGASGLGVHVEVQPFGTTRPFREGRSSPKVDLGLVEDGAFIEFDVPDDLVLLRYSCGPRNAGIILTEYPLELGKLEPKFVKVRRAFWELWRARAE